MLQESSMNPVLWSLTLRVLNYFIPFVKRLSTNQFHKCAVKLLLTQLKSYPSITSWKSDCSRGDFQAYWSEFVCQTFRTSIPYLIT